MMKWIIRINGKRRKEVDKHLVVQAVLALSRQLKEQQAVQDNPSRSRRNKA